MIEVRNVSKSFRLRDQNISVLQELSFSAANGESLAILGPSGSGKSTLLSLLAGLDNPDQGHVKIAGQDISRFSEEQLTNFRSKNLAIVFQKFHLLSTLTALENVMLPLEILGIENPRRIAENALASVGLEHRYKHLPNELSGGEGQRVAIARALVAKPKLLLADEPSGNLDQDTGDAVMDLLFELVEQQQTTFVLVTHNETLAKRCNRRLRMNHGRLS